MTARALRGNDQFEIARPLRPIRLVCDGVEKVRQVRRVRRWRKSFDGFVSDDAARGQVFANSRPELRVRAKHRSATLVRRLNHKEHARRQARRVKARSMTSTTVAASNPASRLPDKLLN